MHQIHKNPYDAIADQYDELYEGNPFYDVVTAKEEAALRRYVPVADGSLAALDVGCGTGADARWLAQRGYKVLGIDLSPAMCAVARQATPAGVRNPTFLQYDARDLTQLNAKFDVVLCLGSTFNHIDDWHRVFEAIGNILKRNGRFIFSFDSVFGIDSFFWLLKRRHSGYAPATRVPNFIEKLRSALTRTSFHNHWIMRTSSDEHILELTYETTRKIKQLLGDNGLKILDHTGANLLSCFVPLVLNSSAELGTALTKKAPGKLAKFILQLDATLADVTPSLAANSIIVSEKTT